MLINTGVSRKRGSYKQYHSSLKLFIASGGNTALAYDLGISGSTISSWKQKDFSRLIAHPLTGSPQNDLLLFQKLLKDRFAIRLFAVYSAISETFHIILHSAVRDFQELLNKSKEILIKTINDAGKVIGIGKTLKIFKISRQRYDMWLRNKQCSASPVGLCVKAHPLQIAKQEVEKLKNFLDNFSIRNWPLNSIYFLGLRSNLFAFSLPTFYKYAELLGFSIFNPKTRRKNYCIGLRSNRINQYWHADVTIFKPIDNVKVFIYLVIDNFSRYILSWRASLDLSAKTRFETIIEAYRMFIVNKPDNPIKLIVDNGSENKTIPLFPTDEFSVRKIVAQQDIIFSNSMIEAFNKQLKYRYLFQKDLQDFNAVVKHLEKSIPDFSNVRPNAQLHGLMPSEVYLQGMIPDKTKFREQLEAAAINRYILNTSKPCPLCSD